MRGQRLDVSQEIRARLPHHTSEDLTQYRVNTKLDQVVLWSAKCVCVGMRDCVETQ